MNQVYNYKSQDVNNSFKNPIDDLVCQWWFHACRRVLHPANNTISQTDISIEQYLHTCSKCLFCWFDSQ
jgi:hypothetical protein